MNFLPQLGFRNLLPPQSGGRSSLFILLLLVGWPLSSFAATYYIDSKNGSDANDGTTASTPWQSLPKVNRVVYQPGDYILFKTGGHWQGSLKPQGSGTAGSPISVGKYGTDSNPVISGEDAAYFVQTKITPISYGSNGMVGLRFMSKDMGNSYLVALSPTAGIQLQKTFRGKSSEIASKVYAFTPDTEYDVRVSKSGVQIDIWINKVLELTASDETFDQGCVGLVTRNAAADFDEVEVQIHQDYPLYKANCETMRSWFSQSGSWSVVETGGGRKYRQKAVLDQECYSYDAATTTGNSAVFLSNVKYWEINNLEITYAGKSPGTRRGIYVTAHDYGIVEHIYIRGNYIHHIAGLQSNNQSGAIITSLTGYPFSGNTPTKFNDLRIEDNEIYQCVASGIAMISDFRVRPELADHVAYYTWYPSTLVTVRNNRLNVLGRQGILTHTCDSQLVEYNIVGNACSGDSGSGVGLFVFNSDNALSQFNEVYETRSQRDGQALDADYNCKNTIYQYNYTHDNEGGAFLIAGGNNPYTAYNTGTIFRYNISQNDNAGSGRGGLITIAYVKNTKIYNNVFYTKASLSPDIIYARNNKGWADDTVYRNNVFYYLGERPNFSLGGTTNNIFDHNMFFGNHASNEPSDAHKLTTDPQFLNPGSGGMGIGTLAGYRLRRGSPGIGSGLAITGNGGRDFWGHAIDISNPNRGAYEGTGLSPDLVNNFEAGNR